jgi:hypothetical protein
MSELWICVECAVYVTNGDLTGIDDDARALDVEQAPGWWVVLGHQWDAEFYREHDYHACDRCGCTAHGERYMASVE